MSRGLFGRNPFGAKAERDRKFELALKHQLRKTSTPAPGAALGSFDEAGCVDAETLGAWTDGGLEAAQMAAIDLHVSSCGRCQAIVRLAARSAPANELLTNEGGFQFPRWALAPIAAAAAIAIWMVVPQNTMQPAQVPAPVEEARQEAAKRQPDPLARDADASAPAKELAGVPDAQRPAPRIAEFSEPARQTANTASPVLEDRAQREDRTAALGGAASASPPPAAPPAEAILQKSEKLAVAGLEVVSPDPSRRWRLANGAIERSENGGASWVATRPISGQTITGGIAPTGSICWLIGSAGMVMLAADGITFTEVPLPEPLDLIAITAADALVATVTAADGRRFRTDDGGRTWRQI